MLFCMVNTKQKKLLNITIYNITKQTIINLLKMAKYGFKSKINIKLRHHWESSPRCLASKSNHTRYTTFHHVQW